MRLWIIGNGFDLYHGLKTRYLDYKAYICQRETCKHEKNRILCCPREVCRNCCKSEIQGRNCIVRKFQNLPRRTMAKEELWSDLEEACSFDFDCLMECARGRECADRIIHEALDFASFFTGKKYFGDWIEDVEKELPECKKQFDGDLLAIRKEEDLFITFNYTRTLEEFYEVLGGRIHYIHGCNESVRREIEGLNPIDKSSGANAIVRKHLVFGSPDSTEKAFRASLERFAESESMSEKRKKELIDGCARLINPLGKNVESGLEGMKKFIEDNYGNLSTIEEIVVAGHSLGRIDRPYFKHLVEAFRCKRWRFLFHNERDIVKISEFCNANKLDGICVPWNCSMKASFGGSPNPVREDDLPCPGFSICWPNK